MDAYVLFDELHVTVRVPADLEESVCEAIQRILEGRPFQTALAEPSAKSSVSIRIASRSESASPADRLGITLPAAAILEPYLAVAPVKPMPQRQLFPLIPSTGGIHQMSHVVSLQTKVHDPAAVAAACQRLNFAPPHQGTA